MSRIAYGQAWKLLC